MAKAALLPQFVLQFFDDNGAVLNGGTLTFYEAGTVTSKDTYTDSTLGTANPNPITLDSAGRPDNSGSPIQIWLDGSYKLLVKDSSGNTIRTEDNLTALAEATGYSAKTANYTVTVADFAKLFNVDATSGNITISLPAAATAGAGFTVSISKSDSSTNTVIIDGNGTETINGATTYTIYEQYFVATIMCDGSNWIVDGSFSESPKLAEINDTNGNEEIVFTATSSAVNHIGVVNSVTTAAPTITSAGDDTNVGLIVDTQGTGAITLGSADTGGVTVTAGGLTVTAGGETITAGGLTVTEGDVTISQGTVTIADEDSRTNTIDDILTLTSTTDGTPAASIGTGVLFRAESADENPSDFGRIAFDATDVTAASEDTDFVVHTRVAGSALAESYRFSNTGAGSYTFTGAPSAERTITLPNSDLTFGTSAMVQQVRASTTAVATGTTQIPGDDTIPQSTEGDEYLTLSITPTSATSILVIEAIVMISSSVAGDNRATIALFQDSTADALAAIGEDAGQSDPRAIPLTHYMTSGTTSSTTFKIRAGCGAPGTTTINGVSSGRSYGGVARTSLIITEYNA